MFIKRYFFSTFEDDNLLCILDDTAYSTDELKFKVIPEKYEIKLDNETIQYLKELSLKNINEKK
jgi:hypothetical protein